MNSGGIGDDLTPQEQEHVRRAIRYLGVRCGTRASLAKALRYQASTIRHVLDDRRTVSANMAFRVARFAGVAIDDLLAGKFPQAGICFYCGHVRAVEGS